MSSTRSGQYAIRTDRLTTGRVTPEQLLRSCSAAAPESFVHARQPGLQRRAAQRRRIPHCFVTLMMPCVHRTQDNIKLT
jgi:hypothetical protein